MGWSSLYIKFIFLVLSNTYQSIGLWLLKTLWKCGENMEAFYASVVVTSLLGSRIRIIMGEAWWLVSPPERIWTLFHASLGLKRMEYIFLLGGQTILILRSAISSYTDSCETLSCNFASDESTFPIPRVQ